MQKTGSRAASGVWPLWIHEEKSMARFTAIAFLLLAPVAAPDAFAQKGEAPIQIFGYFQNSLQHWSTFEGRSEQNSFSLQQLNLMLQKDLRRDWTAFINFEILNNFSSTRKWGALNLEEAWVRYRAGKRLKLKLGLLVPTFNNLNEDKNRTPILPYVIRPLVYETSFNEFIGIENFLPTRAFAQVYGFFPYNEVKVDYAVYLGNSPNVNNDPEAGQTGIDTTTTFLIGGRLGIRHGELKLGLSYTYDEDNQFQEIADTLGRPPEDLKELPRKRLGGDLSYNYSRFSFESEFISSGIDPDLPELEVDVDFYYATLSYNFTEQLLFYGSYWIAKSRLSVLAPDDEMVEKEEILTPNAGVSYDLDERIRLKVHYARVKADEHRRFITEDRIEVEEDNFSVYSAAVSVFF